MENCIFYCNPIGSKKCKLNPIEMQPYFRLSACTEIDQKQSHSIIQKSPSVLENIHIYLMAIGKMNQFPRNSREFPKNSYLSYFHSQKTFLSILRLYFHYWISEKKNSALSGKHINFIANNQEIKLKIIQGKIQLNIIDEIDEQTCLIINK